MKLLREYIREMLNRYTESLTERTDRKNKTKRLLYHINKHRPARPQPKMSYLQQWDKDVIDPDTGERTGDLVNVPGTDNWDRWWLENPVKSGVFLTPNPVDIAMNHGRLGHVYAYRVPEWVIEKSGGLHRYDTGSEVLIPEDIWNKAGKEIEFLGKSMDYDELHAKIDKTQKHGRGSKRKSTKPSWLSDEELKAWEDRQKQFNITGLRTTKHPADAIKILNQEEVKSAIAAIESEYSPRSDETTLAVPGGRKGMKRSDFQKKVTKKDEELLALLKKRLNESAIRVYIRELLAEVALGPTDLPGGVNVQIEPDSNNSMRFLYVDDDSKKLKREDGAAIYGTIVVFPSTAKGALLSKCGGAYEVAWAGAADGWGPLLYDVAMEWATQNGGGLISDRSYVSAAARSVWDYYASNRPDVQVHQLDDLENTLTPIDDDNCGQLISKRDPRYPGKNVDWKESPLSKRYTKQPTTINALRAAGRLIEP